MTILSLAKAATAIAVIFGATASASATDLYSSGSWAALASDRLAERVGDSLTVLIYEEAVATNSAQNRSNKDSRLSGQISAGTSLSESAALSLGGRFDGGGQTGRSGRMVAQISVVVDGVLPNGDLHVSGVQAIKINGELTKIKLRGRVRRADISSGNAVLSSRLADAEIDYDGNGFVTRAARPGLVTRIFNFLGLI